MKKYFPLTIRLTTVTSTHEIILSKVEFDLLTVIDPVSFLLRSALRSPRSKPVIAASLEDVQVELSKLNHKFSDELFFYKYQYYTDASIWGNAGPSTGQISGFQLHNEPDCTFALESGVGVCNLRRMKLDTFIAKGPIEDLIDIRDKEIIETVSTGIIRIEKKPIAKHFRDKIQQLVEWTNTTHGQISVGTI